MSAQYEQAVIQHEQYRSKSPAWYSFAILALLAVIISIVASYFVGKADTSESPTIEFQKTVFEQSNDISDVDYFLLTNQQKNARYFKTLTTQVNQIRHRFGLISEYINTNNITVEQKRFVSNEKVYRQKIDLILASRPQLIAYHISILNMKRVLPKLLSQNTDINNLLFKHKASSMHIYFITRQLFLLERIMNNVTVLGSNSSNANTIVTASDRIGRDMALLLRVYSGLLKGDYQMNVTKITNLEIRSEIRKVITVAKSLSTDVSNVLLHGPEAVQFIDLRVSLQKVSLKLQKSYKLLFFQND